MVRALLAAPHFTQRPLGRRYAGRHLRAHSRHVVIFSLAVVAGCAVVPRSSMDDAHKLTQSLRADNARLKERVLALQGQNRDYAERAVDDAHRLAVQEEAIERLEHSVQAYQDERSRLEAAYKQLVSNFGVAESGDEVSSPSRAGDASGASDSSRVSRKSTDNDEDKPR
jgi:hypothetical protein